MVSSSVSSCPLEPVNPEPNEKRMRFFFLDSALILSLLFFARLILFLRLVETASGFATS